MKIRDIEAADCSSRRTLVYSRIISKTHNTDLLIFLMIHGWVFAFRYVRYASVMYVTCRLYSRSECLRFALFVKQRHVFSSFSRGSSCRKRVDIQKPSWYSFTVKRFAGKIDVDSSRKRIAIDASAITIETRTVLSSVESWMIGDILSVYGEIKI